MAIHCVWTTTRWCEELIEDTFMLLIYFCLMRAVNIRINLYRRLITRIFIKKKRRSIGDLKNTLSCNFHDLCGFDDFSVFFSKNTYGNMIHVHFIIAALVTSSKQISQKWKRYHSTTRDKAQFDMPWLVQSLIDPSDAQTSDASRISCGSRAFKITDRVIRSKSVENKVLPFDYWS